MYKKCTIWKECFYNSFDQKANLLYAAGPKLRPIPEALDVLLEFWVALTVNRTRIYTTSSCSRIIKQNTSGDTLGIINSWWIRISLFSLQFPRTALPQHTAGERSSTSGRLGCRSVIAAAVQGSRTPSLPTVGNMNFRHPLPLALMGGGWNVRH